MRMSDGNVCNIDDYEVSVKRLFIVIGTDITNITVVNISVIISYRYYYCCDLHYHHY